VLCLNNNALCTVHAVLFHFALHVIYVFYETVGRKRKVKLFLCLIKHYAMNECEYRRYSSTG